MKYIVVLKQVKTIHVTVDAMSRNEASDKVQGRGSDEDAGTYETVDEDEYTTDVHAA